jgi:basic membrane protein A and related proteins
MRVLEAAAAAACLLAFALLPGCGDGPSRACTAKVHVAVVAEAGGLTPGSRSAESWRGVQQAASASSSCVLASQVDPVGGDLAGAIQTAVVAGAALVIAAGPSLAPAAAAAARANPAVRFAVANYASDGSLPNLVGLRFRADQAAYLAGAAAGLFTRSNAIGAVYPVETPESEAIRTAFENGAMHVSSKIKIFGVYQPPGPGFDDLSYGRARATDELAQGADVVFDGARVPGTGVLLAAAAQPGRACIGWELDQYALVPEARACLLTSALFDYAVATKTVVELAVSKKLKPGDLSFDVRNGGVGLAPFHQLDPRVSQPMRRALDEVRKGLSTGRLTAV